MVSWRALLPGRFGRHTNQEQRQAEYSVESRHDHPFGERVFRPMAGRHPNFTKSTRPRASNHTPSAPAAGWVSA
jgi:hypothetical protein